MDDAPGTKLEIFLLLAERRRRALPDSGEKTGDIEDFAGENDFPEKVFAALTAQSSAPNAEKLEHLRAAYEKKSAAEQQTWRQGVEDSLLAGGETFLDRRVHRSRVEAALEAETAAVAEIVRAGTSPESGSFPNRTPKTAAEPTMRRRRLEQYVRKRFADQFVRRENLAAATAFDDLDGAGLARLIRLAGVREVALACVRIDAVESVASFLRRFSAEDARAIAAQLNGLPKTAAERLSFAENFVQTALESQLKPASMLDLLGFRLIAITLCGATPERVRYSEQKLPLEVVPKLSETINAQRRLTPIAMRGEIGREIERLAETTAKTTEKVEP